ncbi:MAG: Signal transduction histidine kinase [Acidobacteria bacterium]|nr:Signal transduction histidine kinase [Acidobacteriota bacterium]
MLQTMRAKLTLWYTVVLAIVLIAFAAATYFYFVRATAQRTDDALLESSDLVVASLNSELGEAAERGSQTIREVVNDFQFRDRQIIVFDENHQIVASSQPPEKNRNPKDWPAPEVFAKIPGLITNNGRACSTQSGGHGIRFCGVVLQSPSGTFVIVTAKSLLDEQETLEQVRTALGIAIPVALALAGLGGFLLAKRSLAPVVQMGDQAARISATNLHERLPVKSERDEVGRLAIIINDLLSRLNQSFEQQRRFMADASHELRTPLSSVLGEAEVALSKTHRDEIEYRQSLDSVYKEGTRMSRIVEDLLSLARADSGQLAVRPVECFLGDLVEDCIRALKHGAEKREVALSFTRPAVELVVQGDAELLRRLFMNLLDNAIKYTKPGGVVTAVLYRRQAECIFAVQDTGRGIAVEAQAHIFERFYREDRVRGRNIESQGSGAGLGLSIAQWIANLHGGRVTLEDSSEKGSTFSVRLPGSLRD